MNWLKAVFSGEDNNASENNGDEQRWIESLPRGAEALAIARLMIELGHADGDFDDAERNVVTHSMAREFALSSSDAKRLFDYAEVKFGGQVEFSGLIMRLKRDCTDEERAEILRLLWKMAYADGTLDDAEFTLIRRMASMLFIQPQAIGRARRQALVELGFDPETPAGQNPVKL